MNGNEQILQSALESAKATHLNSADAFWQYWIGLGNVFQSLLHQQLTSAAPPAENTEDAGVRGPFQLDVTRGILNANKGAGFLVPQKFMPVLKLLLRRDSDAKCRPGVISYGLVAAAYRRGGIEASVTCGSEKVVEQRLREQRAEIEQQAVKIAQEFRRSFNRWLREHHIDCNSVLRCNRAVKAYCLGDGWHQSRPVINTGQPRLYYGSNYSEVASESFAPSDEVSGDGHAEAES